MKISSEKRFLFFLFSCAFFFACGDDSSSSDSLEILEQESSSSVESSQNSSETQIESSSETAVESSSETAVESSSSEVYKDSVYYPDGWNGEIAESYEGGDGSDENPYLIKTPGQLALLQVQNDSGLFPGTTHAKLIADIALNTRKILDDKGNLIADTTKLVKWQPIGTLENKFGIWLDGDGHTINAMYMYYNNYGCGLVDLMDNGYIKNLTIADSYVECHGPVAAFTAKAKVGHFSNVVNYATVVGNDVVGGIIAEMDSYYNKYDVSVSNAKNYGVLKGERHMGGIAGICRGYVGNSVNEGSVTSIRKEINALEGGFGGIVGVSEGCDINNAVNKGPVTGEYVVGGILGDTDINKSELTFVRNEGTVTGWNSVGGIAGSGDYDIIQDAVNLGKVVGKKDVGGLMGYSHDHENILDSYNQGEVVGDSIVGGLVGYMRRANVHRVYNAGKVTCSDVCAALVAETMVSNVDQAYYLSGSSEKGIFEVDSADLDGADYIVYEPLYNFKDFSEEEMKSSQFLEMLADTSDNHFIHVENDYPGLKEDDSP